MKCFSCFKSIHESDQFFSCCCCQNPCHVKCSVRSNFDLLTENPNSCCCYSYSISNIPLNHLDEVYHTNALNELKHDPSRLRNALKIEEMHINPFSLYDKYKTRINNFNDIDSWSNSNDKYFVDNEFNQLIKTNKISQINSFSLLHINARSLSKNFDALEHMLDLLENNFNIIGVTETWMYQPTSLTNLTKYNFECFGKKNRAGDVVGIYILNDTDNKLRNDINLNCHLWNHFFIEVINKNEKNTLIGVIYRPPNQDIMGF